MTRTAEYPVVISAEPLETKKSPAFFITYLTVRSLLLVQHFVQYIYIYIYVYIYIYIYIINDMLGMT
jgi:hypothetical protein